MYTNLFYKQNVLTLLSLLLSTLILMTSDDTYNETHDTPNENIEAPYHIEVYGNVDKLAYYYILLNVGYPPQTQTLIIDSGSSVTSFSCSDCSECGRHISKKFDKNLSKTGKWTEFNTNCDKNDNGICSYEIAYMENSRLAGSFMTDYISLGDDDAHTPVFIDEYIGCHKVETNQFSEQMVSGIMGIGKSKTRKNLNIFNNLLSNYDEQNNLYSLCLANEGGAFLIGGYTHPKIPHTHITWINAKATNNYKSKLTNVNFDKKSLSSKTYTTIFDSGTTHSYLPSPLFESLIEQINSTYPFDYSNDNCPFCYTQIYYEEALEIFPTISLTFDNDTKIEWRPASYLSQRLELLEVGIAKDYKDRVTLGMTFLKNNLLVFDYNNERIGVAPAKCPTAAYTHTKANNLKLDWFTVEGMDLNENINKNDTHSIYNGLKEFTKLYERYIAGGLMLFAGITSISLLMIIFIKCFKRKPSMGYTTIDDGPDDTVVLNLENELNTIELEEKDF